MARCGRSSESNRIRQNILEGVGMFDWPQIDWDAFVAKRRSLFADFMKREKLDHAMLCGFDNIRWATDIRTNYTHDSNYDWFCAIVETSGEVSLITNDGGSTEERPFASMPWLRRRIAGPSWTSHWAHPTVFVRLAVEALRAQNAKRVGVEGMHFEIMDGLRQQLPDVEFVPILRPLLQLRKIKLPEEIKLVEAACEAASVGMSAGINGVREGMRDIDVIAVTVDAVYRCGAEQLSHAVIVAQSSPSEGGWFARGERLWKGQTFFMDMGCYGVGGYCSDFCRVGFVGEPHRSVRKAYTDLSEVLDSTAAELRPGIRCSAIRETINAALKKKGLPETPYSMGHGIGARLVEYPSIFTPELMDYDDALEEGMIICLEPSTHVEVNDVVVGLKDENQYVVETAGLRKLTRCGRVID